MNDLNHSQQPPAMQKPHGASPAPFSGRINITPTKPEKLLRLPTVEDRTALKKSSIYAGFKEGTFPAPVRLSSRAVAWREADIDHWIKSRVTTAAVANWEGKCHE